MSRATRRPVAAATRRVWRDLSDPPRRPGRRPDPRRAGGRGGPTVSWLDWMVRNMRTGRFERSLSALTGLGAAVTAGEIFVEHDRASFGNRMMWWPVALGPVGLAAGVAGYVNRRAAKTALPIASALLVANGVQGTYLHARGIAQRPGGFGVGPRGSGGLAMARYNVSVGPPPLAPLLVTMVGGLGLLAAVLRREGESR
jgi:hypothetical protein